MALLKKGEVKAAVREFQRLLKSYPISSIHISLYFLPTPTYWPISAAKAHYGLALAFEELGERDKAIKEYEEFLKIWRDADFNSVEMADARSRLERLKSTAAK